MPGIKYVIFCILLLSKYWPATVGNTCPGREDDTCVVSGTDAVLPFWFSPFGPPNFQPNLLQVVMIQSEEFTSDPVLSWICSVDDAPCQMSHREGKYQLDIDPTAGANLTIYGVQLGDELSYRCLFSFTNRPGDSLCRRLHVQVPPRDLEIQGRDGRLLDGKVIVREGDDLDVRCIARGAKPSASIAWYLDDRMVRGDFINVTSSSKDPRLNDTRSRLVIPALGTLHNLQKLICKAMIGREVTQKVNVTLLISSKPWLEGLDDVNPSTTDRKFRCGFQGGYAGPQITWFLGQRNVTMNSSTSHASLASGHFNTSSELSLTLTLQDNGKTLRCIINHVTLDESLTLDGVLRVCAMVDVDVAISNIDTSSVTLQTDIKPRAASEAIHCDLKTCNVNSRNVTVLSQCITTPVYNIGLDNYYQVPDLEPSTRYSVRLSCRNDCGETYEEIQFTTLHLEKSNVENNWVRKCVIGIVVVVVLTVVVIAVAVPIVLSTVVRGKLFSLHDGIESESISPTAAQPDANRRWSNFPVLIIVAQCQTLNGPSSIAVEVGSDAELRCSVTGGTSPVFTWSDDSVDPSITMFSGGNKLTSNAKYADFRVSEDAISSALTIIDTQIAEEGSYVCQASGMPNPAPAAQVSVEELNTTLIAGESYEAVCRAVGGRPSEKFVWYLNGEQQTVDPPNSTLNAGNPDLSDTTSSFNFTPTEENFGMSLRCETMGHQVASLNQNQSIPFLNVHFPPHQSPQIITVDFTEDTCLWTLTVICSLQQADQPNPAIDTYFIYENVTDNYPASATNTLNTVTPTRAPRFESENSAFEIPEEGIQEIVFDPNGELEMVV
ncbi:uncharacterized protein [Diadema setosum]|uniref:uncharacterized protein n=1 Tax=Diadema setosum TaxID=31175 RepID=UPI003B3AEA69